MSATIKPPMIHRYTDSCSAYLNFYVFVVDFLLIFMCIWGSGAETFTLDSMPYRYRLDSIYMHLVFVYLYLYLYLCFIYSISLFIGCCVLLMTDFVCLHYGLFIFYGIFYKTWQLGNSFVNIVYK